jgi:hypothetical protein
MQYMLDEGLDCQKNFNLSLELSLKNFNYNFLWWVIYKEKYYIEYVQWNRF